ncbi:DUF2149 domain-containing protein [Thioalkalivibrio sp. AKL10]|uniref:DUF2149 domain-containing protein n=1 Tax=Thioalkalivibrio sp. AKL10 TaxID=1158158 RepID=UPI000360531B|nr:DUF2149 domain-containing protein [Thioalkalivibrio sp. AKL10]
MRVPHYRASRFDAPDEEPMGPLANLADIMLVFAVGLMVVMAASGGGLEPASGGAEIEPGREIPDPPEGAGEAGSGYESVGQVYRDPETGRMILIGE